MSYRKSFENNQKYGKIIFFEPLFQSTVKLISVKITEVNNTYASGSTADIFFKYLPKIGVLFLGFRL